MRGEDFSGYWYPKPHLVVDRLETRDEDEALVRPHMDELPVNKRVDNFEEVELGLNGQAALLEARRCLRCDL